MNGKFCLSKDTRLDSRNLTFFVIKECIENNNKLLIV